MTDKRLVLTTTDSFEQAQQIGQALVEKRLAACVNIVPGMQSIYRWKDRVEQATEWMLLIKTKESLLDTLRAAIRQFHSYDVPEFIAITIDSGSPEYLEWLETSVEQA